MKPNPWFPEFERVEAFVLRLPEVSRLYLLDVARNSCLSLRDNLELYGLTTELPLHNLCESVNYGARLKPSMSIARMSVSLTAHHMTEAYREHNE